MYPRDKKTVEKQKKTIPPGVLLWGRVLFMGGVLSSVLYGMIIRYNSFS